jgi:hypothetical protein
MASHSFWAVMIGSQWWDAEKGKWGPRSGATHFRSREQAAQVAQDEGGAVVHAGSVDNPKTPPSSAFDGTYEYDRRGAGRVSDSFWG